MSKVKSNKTCTSFHVNVDIGPFQEIVKNKESHGIEKKI